MWLVLAALRRPITILVAVLSLALCSIIAVLRMRADIFPDHGSLLSKIGFLISKPIST